MSEVGQSFKEKVRAEAQKEIQDEKFVEAKDKLLSLYRKQAAAEKVLKNISNEIADYEMEIEGKQ